jgi:cytidine deaminase
MEHERLLEEARRALASAYAPYSGFRVGAALLAGDGTVWTGCNVENGSFGLTVCAERVAVFRAVTEGRRSFRAIALASDAQDPVPPCGACLQVLSEFASDLTIVSVGGQEGRETKKWMLSELLPERFGGSQLLSRTDEKHT